MKSIGIVRQIDNVGRVVIPKETRSILGMNNGVDVEIFVEGDSVIIKKYNPIAECVFCHNKDTMQTYKGKNICLSCMQHLRIK